MTEHLRHLSQHARTFLSCLPNAGLPSIVDGAHALRPHARRAGRRPTTASPPSSASTSSAAAAARRPSTSGGSSRPVGGRAPAPRAAGGRAGAARRSTPRCRSPRTCRSSRIGERTNANGSRKFRDAMLAGDWDTCVQMAREQVKEGAHVLDVCVDYVGRDGVADMHEIAGRFATQAAAAAGARLHRAARPRSGPAAHRRPGPPQLRQPGGRGGARLPLRPRLRPGPGVRRGGHLPHHRRGGPGPHGGVEVPGGQADPRPGHRAVRARARRPDLRRADVPARHRPGGPAPGRHRDDGGHPPHQGRAARRLDRARRVQRQLRPEAGHPPRPQLGVPPRVRRRPASTPPSSTPPGSCRCTASTSGRRSWPSTSSTTGGGDGYDPLTELMAAFEDVEAGVVEREDRSGWAVEERLKARIIDGDRDGLEADLDEALAGGRTALSIINDVLLEGMKVVGELFGSGQMQLPFVLQSAETMKTAVAFLEPHMEKADSGGKGRVVLGTVKGDVHDIGKNLVDIILTNNGYEVNNLGIKVPIAAVRRGRRGVQGRRHRHERPAGEEHADHAGEPRGAERPGPGEDPRPPRRRRPHPQLRRAGPARDLQGPAVLRQGRLRGPAHHGNPHRREEERPARPRLRPGAGRAGAAAPQVAAEGRGGRPVRRSRPARRWPPTTRCSCRRSSAPGWPRASPSTTSPPTSTRRPCSATSGSSGPSQADGNETDERVQGPDPPDAAGRAGQGQGGRHAGAGGGLGLLPGQRRRQRPGRVDRRRPHGGADAVHRSPASARNRGSRSPTSSARCQRARPTTPPSTW